MGKRQAERDTTIAGDRLHAFLNLIPVTAGIALTLTAYPVVFERSIVSQIEGQNQSCKVIQLPL